MSKSHIIWANIKLINKVCAIVRHVGPYRCSRAITDDDWSIYRQTDKNTTEECFKAPTCHRSYFCLLNANELDLTNVCTVHWCNFPATKTSAQHPRTAMTGEVLMS